MVFDLSYNIPIFPSFNLVRAEYALGPELITIKLFQSLDDGLMVLERRYSNKVKLYLNPNKFPSFNVESKSRLFSSSNKIDPSTPEVG